MHAFASRSVCRSLDHRSHASGRRRRERPHLLSMKAGEPPVPMNNRLTALSALVQSQAAKTVHIEQR